MAAKKKNKTAKKATSSRKEILVKVVNDNALKAASMDSKIIVTTPKIVLPKVYPPIYTYIYEREPEDMAKIYEEHKNSSDTPKTVKQIEGFKLVNGELVAVSK